MNRAFFLGGCVNFTLKFTPKWGTMTEKEDSYESTHEKDVLLAPFEIWEVLLDNSTIKFHKPLVLTPTWMPDDWKQAHFRHGSSASLDESSIPRLG